MVIRSATPRGLFGYSSIFCTIVFLILKSAHSADKSLTHEAFYRGSLVFPSSHEEPFLDASLEKKLRNLKPTKTSKVFKTRGSIASFVYEPKTYRERHKIFYYVPETFNFVRYPAGIPALVFLHGGGLSTSTHEGAERVASSYFRDLLPIIKDLEMIAIFPSSSVGWGNNTRMLLRELNPIVRSELPVDPDRMVLSGHSMGGMGITRQAHHLIDQFSSFLPMAAGMQRWARKPRNLATYFDTTFVHINGENDHFRSFKRRSLRVEEKISKLESAFGIKSGYELFFHDGGHNYDKNLFKNQLQKLTQKKRNLYDKEIFPIADRFVDYQFRDQPKYKDFLSGTYKWLEVSKWHKTSNDPHEAIDYRARIEDNLIVLRMDKNAKKTIKELKIYLSDRMIDYSKQVFLMLNGRLIYGGYPKRDYELMYKLAQEKKDHRFLFTSILRFNIKYERAKWTKETLW
jgi:hypothetical protein